MQTAVEWLLNQDISINLGSGIKMKIPIPIDILEQAKEMEKQQIMLAHSFGGSNMEGGKDNFNFYDDNNHYYNEMYPNATNQ